MYDVCMATKTISIELDAYDLLKREKRDERESFSQVIRRIFAERPVLTAGQLTEAMKGFEGRRRRQAPNQASCCCLIPAS